MVQQLSEAASTLPEAVLVSPYDEVSLQKINNNVPHIFYSSVCILLVWLYCLSEPVRVVDQDRMAPHSKARLGIGCVGVRQITS